MEEKALKASAEKNTEKNTAERNIEKNKALEIAFAHPLPECVLSPCLPGIRVAPESSFSLFLSTTYEHSFFARSMKMQHHRLRAKPAGALRLRERAMFTRRSLMSSLSPSAVRGAKSSPEARPACKLLYFVSAPSLRFLTRPRTTTSSGS